MPLIQFDLSKRESKIVDEVKRKLNLNFKGHAIKKLIVIADDMGLIDDFLNIGR